MRYTALTAVLATALSIPTAAGELRQEWIPRDAIWVAHLDFEALRKSSLFEFIAENTGIDGREVQHSGGNNIKIDLSELDELRTKYGIDPFKDLLSVTAFGQTTDDEEGTFLVRTTSALDGAIAKLREETPELFDLDSGNYRLLSWSGHDAGFAYVKNLGDERLLMVSHDEQALTDAIDVTEGRQPNLSAGGAATLLAKPRAGAFVSVAVASGLDALDWNNESPLAQSAKTLRFELGESGGNLFAAGIIETDSAQSARDVVDTARGLLAMARLFGGNEPEMQKILPLLNNLRIEERGMLVNASFAIPIDVIFSLIQELHEIENGDHQHEHEGDATPVNNGKKEKKGRRQAL